MPGTGFEFSSWTLVGGGWTGLVEMEEEGGSVSLAGTISWVPEVEGLCDGKKVISVDIFVVCF